MKEPWIERWHAVVYWIAAVAAFHLAYQFPSLAFLMAVFLLCIFRLAWAKTTRAAFYSGLLLGLAIYGPQLAFFWHIFGPAAIALWLILALWPAIFLTFARSCLGSFQRPTALILIPILWTGLEYFRSELYYLRFSWLTPGFAFSHAPSLQCLGVYGLGFVLIAIVALLHLPPRRIALAIGLTLLAALAALVNGLPAQHTRPANPPGPMVVGIQLEHPSPTEALHALTSALDKYPDADLFVLSEYSFGGEPPEQIRQWCQDNKRYLIAGGMDWLDRDHEVFRDSAFVVGPEGAILFSQAKSVPVQFFPDGLPAANQQLWPSPWGKIGICICYDLSYTRVTDELLRQGATLLVVPTMDLTSWGPHEHQLHARVAPIRAAEYHVPIVRVCSSGISQIVSSDGTVLATAPFPGPGGLLHARVPTHPGRLPLDRQLAPACVAITALVLAILLARKTHQRWTRPAPQKKPSAASTLTDSTTK